MDGNTGRAKRLRLANGRVLDLHLYGNLPLLLEEEEVITVTGEDGDVRLPSLPEILALVADRFGVFVPTAPAADRRDGIRPAAESRGGDPLRRRLGVAEPMGSSVPCAPTSEYAVERVRAPMDRTAAFRTTRATRRHPRLEPVQKAALERAEAAMNRVATRVATESHVPVSRAYELYLAAFDEIRDSLAGRGIRPATLRTFRRWVDVIRDMFARMAPERLVSPPATIH